jgi:putative hemolysin
VVLPPLFKVYLDMGAKVCSEPAIDREFGVVDFLIVLDVENLDVRTQRRMFGSSSNPKGTVQKVSKKTPPRRDYKH